MSKKFTTAQQNYAVHELETLAILEALFKWEDKLIGYRIHVITDHKALEFFKTQINLSPRQRQWIDYMSHFDFDITYVKGELNKVADCLSCYFESDTPNETHKTHKYVRADTQLDPSGEDLLIPCFHKLKEQVIEIHALCSTKLRWSCRLVERQDTQDLEAQAMAKAFAPPSGRNSEPPPSIYTDDGQPTPDTNEDTTLADALFYRTPESTPTVMGDDKFLNTIKREYEQDTLFTIMLKQPDKHKGFTIHDSLLWCTNTRGNEVLCIPWNPKVITTVMDQAHATLGHFSDQRTAEYLRQWYWWPQLLQDVRHFCKTCKLCQRSKGSTKKPTGKLHPLPILTKPWDSIGMV
jgi:hypothetical protein